MNESMHVRRVEVVLLVPGRGRQHDVGIKSARRHTEIERHHQVELALRRRIAPRYLMWLFLTFLTEVLPLQSMPCAEEMLQKIFVSLARGAEQIRTPDEQIAREIVRIVRVLAGQLQRTRFQARCNEFTRSEPGLFRLGRD